MTSPVHAAVWLDHQEARIFHVDLNGFDEKMLRSPHHTVHRHPKGASEPHAHPDDLTHFFGELATALAPAEQILVLGPSTAKTQFVHYLHEHARELEKKVVAVETVDHPTDGQLAAAVEKYFHVPRPRVR
jgi:stalled ribosome rescue protein Dom34